MKSLATVRGRQYIDAFSEEIKKHIYPIAGTVNDCYNQFTKQDANTLCTKTFLKHFVKQEVMVPWNIIIFDEDQEGEPYATGTHNIEVLLLFRISAIETVQVTVSVGTLDALVEYRKCSDSNVWYTVCNEYVTVAPEHITHPKHKTIIEYCEERSKD